MAEDQNWITHDGGELPVTGDTKVFILCRQEKEYGVEINVSASRADALRWKHKGWGGDIVGYRLAETETGIGATVTTTLIPHLAYEPRKGTWWRSATQTFWGCPKCGQAHALTPHTVLEDGEVVPSVICAKCGFHDYVTLDEVAPEAVTKQTT